MLKRTRSNTIIHSSDYDYKQYYNYARKTDQPFEYTEDIGEMIEKHLKSKKLTQAERIILIKQKKINKMNWIINDGEKIKTLKHFLTDLDYLNKQSIARPPSARATTRYGKTITGAISSSENTRKSSKDFIKWLRA